MKKSEPLSFKEARLVRLKERKSKIKVDMMAGVCVPGVDFKSWFGSLPDVLAVKDLRTVVDRISDAVIHQRQVILGMGAHPIKVGLSPIIIELLGRGIITGISMNGAGIIHDTEMAMAGHTSEDVEKELEDGSFGMVEDTGSFLNNAIKRGAEQGLGLGEAVGRAISDGDFPYKHISILAQAYEKGVPVTVHVAIGTDIIHCHPSSDGSSIGKCSHLDFRIFAGLISSLEGGVFINLGSAVIIPEVFLKALSISRNLGYNIKNFTTVNMDFIKHYRPMMNVIKRPTSGGGDGFALVGHHEIMFPLLAMAVIERLKEKDTRKGE